MPRVKPEERKRAKRPKTRTGCKTCKSAYPFRSQPARQLLSPSQVRRVKCDEARPECHRCTSTGRICDGYESDSGDSQQLTQCVDIISSVFKSSEEKRAFQFFQERTSRQISGLSESEFWTRTILQALFTDPSIRCAVVAFGSLHEGFEKTGNTRDSADEFALQQYNAAIRHHIDNLSGLQGAQDKVDNYIASCMIFVCIEILQGHYQSALSLVKGAVKLFYGCNGSLIRLSAWPLQILESLLSRLQSQAVGLIGFEWVGDTVPPRLKAASFPLFPHKFSNVQQAREFLEFYSNTHALTRTSKECFSHIARPNSEQFHLYLSVLTQWTNAFETLVATQGATFSEEELRDVNILRIWQIMTATGITMHLRYHATRDDQTLWDQFEETHKQVVDLAELVYKGANGSHHLNRTVTHQFTLDVGIVGPLYDTARVCRDPVIRRRAINLLREYPCREGLWDSLLAARAAERQMEIEESAVPGVRCAADIPSWARVTGFWPKFHIGERWCEVVYTRQQREPLPAGEPKSFCEIFQW